MGLNVIAMKGVLPSEEKECASHKQFRCGQCYPEMFEVPSITIRRIDPSADPCPREAIRINDDVGGMTYISSNQARALAMMLGLMYGYTVPQKEN